MPKSLRLLLLILLILFVCLFAFLAIPKPTTATLDTLSLETPFWIKHISEYGVRRDFHKSFRGSEAAPYISIEKTAFDADGYFAELADWKNRRGNSETRFGTRETETFRLFWFYGDSGPETYLAYVCESATGTVYRLIFSAFTLEEMLNALNTISL
jgi:hypothetical protein